MIYRKRNQMVIRPGGLQALMRVSHKIVLNRMKNLQFLSLSSQKFRTQPIIVHTLIFLFFTPGDRSIIYAMTHLEHSPLSCMKKNTTTIHRVTDSLLLHFSVKHTSGMTRRNTDVYKTSLKSVLQIRFLLYTMQLTSKHSFIKQNILKYANY